MHHKSAEAQANLQSEASRDLLGGEAEMSLIAIRTDVGDVSGTRRRRIEALEEKGEMEMKRSLRTYCCLARRDIV